MLRGAFLLLGYKALPRSRHPCHVHRPQHDVRRPGRQRDRRSSTVAPCPNHHRSPFRDHLYHREEQRGGVEMVSK